MKLLSLIFCLVLIANLGHSQETPKPVKSEIKSVTVFIAGAQVTREGNASITPGLNYLIFEELPLSINPQSVQVSGKGDFTIMSVKHQTNYMKPHKLQKDIKQIKDSMDMLNEQIQAERDLQVVYQEEEAMIKANKSIGGSNVGVKIQDLKDGAEYMRVRLTDIKVKWQLCAKKINKLTETWQRLSNQLNTLNATEQPTSEVLVLVSSKIATQGTFIVSYAVNNAGWVPLYDLRAKDVSNPVDLMYKANVYQSTGEDWKNVQLTMSTGNPSVSGTKPILNPWYLYLNYDYTRKKASQKLAMTKMKEVASETNGAAADDYEMDRKESKSLAESVEVSENTTNIEFKIDMPYSVPGDNQFYQVEMQKYSIPALFEYYCAPKIDKDAFLLAKVIGWEQYNLLPGAMNIYFEGTFVGESNLDLNTTNDTLDISLGRDKSIHINRTKLKDFSKKQLVGTKKTESRMYEIEVRNKKKQAINILIEDQIPLTTNSELEIERLEGKDAKFDETTGIVSWKLTVQPSETKKVKTGYSAKYPKEQRLFLD